MKVELKHLAGYLPYGLKAVKLYRPHGQENKVKESIIEIKGLFIDSDSLRFVANMGYDNYCDSSFKPILRPLSDLTEEIEHNGESFIPIDWLEDKYYTLSLHKECERLLEEYGHLWFNQMSHLLVIHLYEWHFDVHNLIPNGLAININDLNK